MKRRPLAPALVASLALVASAALQACGPATWSEARDAAADASPLTRAELAFVVDHDPAAALAAAESILATADPASPEAGRALMLALEASRASGELERPLTYLAKVLTATRDPALARRLANECDRFASRLDGGSVFAGKDALEAVLTRPGAAWEPARFAAARELSLLGHVAGEPDPAPSAARPDDLRAWRLSAPWGRAPELDFDRPLGPETRALAAEERSGAGWDLTPTRTTEARFSDGEVTFFDLQQGGVGFAETQLGAPWAGQRTMLRIESNRYVRLFLDGVELARRTRPDDPWLASAVAEVPAAGARLTVKLASPDGTGFFKVTLSVLGEGPVPAPPKISLAVGDAASAILALSDFDEHLSRPLVDVAGARLRLASLERHLGPSPLIDLLAARAARIDARTPAPIQRKDARARLDAVRAVWPKNPVALRALARLEKEAEQPDRALSLLGELGGDARTLLERLDIQRSRGWEADALETVAALRMKPGLVAASPRVLQEIVDAERVFGRLAAARADAAALLRAFPGAGTARFAELELDLGRPGAAADLYDQAFAMEPERHVLLRSAIAALRADGGVASMARAAAMLDAFLAMRPDDAWAHAERGRLALQLGDAETAHENLALALAQHPDFAPVEELLADLAGKPQAFDALDDGRVLLAAYRDDPKVAGWSDFPIVSVLEKNIVDVRADGSTLELQHKLRIVQSKAAADALGDFAPPDGARLLVARTLKADGRVLYPERTQGKADLSFPELQVGDAVETAYVVRSRVSPGEGGYLTGVSFAGWSAPTYRQDARFHLAKGLALVATRFAGAPEPAVTREADGSRTWAWTGLTLPPVPREPLAVGARSFFPFADLRVAVDGDGVDAAEGAERAWQAIATSFAARLERVLAPGPRTTALARQLATLESDFTWVKTDMEDAEQLNLFETPVESAIAVGKGHRALALLALARAQGRSAELWLCAPERDGAPEDRRAPTPNANRFFYPLVVVARGDGRVFLDPSRPWMPFDAMPAELRGARCLVPERIARDAARGADPVDAAALWSDVPAADPREKESFEVEVDIRLAENGDATANLRGLARGVPSVILRQLWQGFDESRRKALWEQWSGSLVLGARLLSFDVKDAEDPEQPMRWTLSLELPGWASVEGGVYTVAKPFATLAAPDLASAPGLSIMASLPARQTPLRVSPHSEKVVLRVTLPPGTSPSELPSDLDASYGPHHLTQRTTTAHVGKAEVVTIERHARFAPARIDPADYPAFRTFVDQAERTLSAPLRIR